MTQAQQYTKAIAELPDRTRHIVAGIVAYKLDEYDDGTWKPLWEMCREHEAHYEWPKTWEVAQALDRCGFSLRHFSKELALYNSYGDDVMTGGVR